jgi:hypothetical protein
MPVKFCQRLRTRGYARQFCAGSIGHDLAVFGRGFDSKDNSNIELIALTSEG